MEQADPTPEGLINAFTSVNHKKFNEDEDHTLIEFVNQVSKEYTCQFSASFYSFE